jgi:hypothetical protein
MKMADFSAARNLTALALVLLLMLGACGGGDGRDPGCGPTSPPFGTRPSASISFNFEVEPNDDLTNANSQTLPTHRPGGGQVGFGVVGSLGDAMDAVDFFLFTAERAHEFDIELWASPQFIVDACVPVIVDSLVDPSVAYFEVLGQNGTLLLSSQGDTAVGNMQEIALDAGVPYYVAVYAEATLNATQRYYVLAVEKVPPP